MLCQEITKPSALSARESEAILVIKQLQDQVLVFFFYNCRILKYISNKYALNPNSQVGQLAGVREGFDSK